MILSRTSNIDRLFCRLQVIDFSDVPNIGCLLCRVARHCLLRRAQYRLSGRKSLTTLTCLVLPGCLRFFPRGDKRLFEPAELNQLNTYYFNERLHLLHCIEVRVSALYLLPISMRMPHQFRHCPQRSLLSLLCLCRGACVAVLELRCLNCGA
jgi:hypothetical protein